MFGAGSRGKFSFVIIEVFVIIPILDYICSEGQGIKE